VLHHVQTDPLSKVLRVHRLYDFRAKEAPGGCSLAIWSTFLSEEVELVLGWKILCQRSDVQIDYSMLKINITPVLVAKIRRVHNQATCLGQNWNMAALRCPMTYLGPLP
jgi:hypothetical protein